jgi:hypothetical protein
VTRQSAHGRRIADSRHPFPIYMGGGFCFLGKSFGAFLKSGIEVSSLVRRLRVGDVGGRF